MYYEIKCVLHIYLDIYSYLFVINYWSFIDLKESLYVFKIRMTKDLLPIKPQLSVILDLFFNENLKSF